MKFITFLLLFCCCFNASFAQNEKKINLPNGWSITPAGRNIPLGDLPLNIAVSASKKYIAVTNNGQSVQSIQLIDPKTEKILHTVTIPKSWYGLQFSANEKFLYASGGNDNWILRYPILNNKLNKPDTFLLGNKWPNRISPAGIALDELNNKMYVVTKDDNSLYIFNIQTKAIINKIALGAEAYTCILSPDRKQLYISLWGGDKLVTINTNTLAQTSLPVGDNPNEICLSKNGRFLYVANANDNSVSVIDTKKNTVIETLNAALYPDAVVGSTSNGVALSEDEKQLYIANADNNCLAVFDVKIPGASKSAGYIPTGWFPTNVKVIGKKIFVTNGKGFSSMANPYGPNPIGENEEVNFQKGDLNKPKEVQYIGGLFKGTMSIIDVPTEMKLSVWSTMVYKNSPYTKEKERNAAGEIGNPIPMKVGDSSPIKYVFYIVKENRTYDQVLGDMPEGNGDTSLVLFGKNITPNQHKIAKEFVLLDNFYVDGEVSADGHNWSLGAYSTDYLEKNWPTNYGGRGGNYDAEGTREIANNKNGFIWDLCKRNGVSYRTYGEFADDYKANLPVLENHFCTYFTSWDQSVRDTTRVRQWRKDFDSLYAINAVPKLNTFRFINDHTEGLTPGRPTPFAHVADNDLACGMFIEELSKTPIWKESAVFILEDDAQDGPDHVDAHRSIAFVAGGFVKRGFVDHTAYTTTSMLRTMELILGLPPMTQFDAAATPMWNCFSKTANLTPFTAVPALVDLTQKNSSKKTPLALKSMKFDFTKEDRVPAMEFNEVIWKAVKGENSVMPAPVRSAFLKSEK